MQQINSFSSPILTQSIESVAIKLREICGIPNIKVMGITEQQFNRELGRVHSSDKFVPYWNVMPVSMENDTTYNSFVASNMGFRTRQVGDCLFKFKLIPVKFMLRCMYYTQNTQQLLACMQKLSFNQRRSSFRLSSESGFDVDIWTQVDSSLEFPQKNMSTGESYVLSTTMSLHTYAGEIFKYIPVKQINVNLIEQVGNAPKEESKPTFVPEIVFTVKQIGEDDEQFKQGCGRTN